MTIKILSFDLDDTLWPCMVTIKQAEENLHQWYSVHYPEITSQYSVNDLWQKRQVLMLENPNLSHNISAIRKLSLKNIAQELKLTTDRTEHLISKGFEKYHEERNQVCLYDEVYDVIKGLAKQYVLFSISNGNAVLNKTPTGLEQFFSFSHNAENAGVQKPHPNIFNDIINHAFYHYQATANEIIHIGDDPVADIFGAKNTGLKTIWVNREKTSWPSHLPKADHSIVNFNNIEYLIES